MHLTYYQNYEWHQMHLRDNYMINLLFEQQLIVGRVVTGLFALSRHLNLANHSVCC